MQKKILITGANGFVGYHLLKAALAKGFEVYAGIRKGSNISHLKNLNIQFSYLQYSNFDSLMRDFGMKQYDFIIHAAGVTKANDYQTYQEINAEYTLNIAKAAQVISPKKIVFISSLAAVGPAKYNDIDGITENTKPIPLTSYGKSKLLAEKYLNNSSDLNWVIIRPTAVYGPREKDLLMLIKALNKGVEIYLGKNKQILSFIHVYDLANAALQACLSDHVYQTYNISDGKKYDTRMLSEIIKRELNKKTLKITIPVSILRLIANVIEQVNDGKTSILNKDKISELIAENWSCSIEKAQQELSFNPQYDLRKGMKNTIDWYKKNKWI